LALAADALNRLTPAQPAAAAAEVMDVTLNRLNSAQQVRQASALTDLTLNTLTCAQQPAAATGAAAGCEPADQQTSRWLSTFSRPQRRRRAAAALTPAAAAFVRQFCR
jgi:hypothetical protein